MKLNNWIIDHRGLAGHSESGEYVEDKVVEIFKWSDDTIVIQGIDEIYVLLRK